MAYLIKQPFLESVDGSRSLFTTADNFQAGSLWLVQGSLVIPPAAYVEIAPNHVRFVDPESVLTWTLDATAATLYCEGHQRALNDPVVITSSAADGLPGGLVAEVLYYAIPVTANTLQLAVTEDGAAIGFGSTSSGTLTLATPQAPTTSDGILYYNALTSTDLTDLGMIGLWSVSLFQAVYGLSATISTAQSQHALARADARVQRYLTAAAYADALLPEPVDPLAAQEIKATIGDLARHYLYQHGVASGSVTSHTETFAGAVTVSETYGNSRQSAATEQPEAVILARLVAWKRAAVTITTTTNLFLSHPSGRFLGVLEADEDDEI